MVRSGPPIAAGGLVGPCSARRKREPVGSPDRGLTGTAGTFLKATPFVSLPVIDFCRFGQGITADALIPLLDRRFAETGAVFGADLAGGVNTCWGGRKW